MTTPQEALIEKLEKATGPDRELDAAIAVAIFVTKSTEDDLIYAKERARDGSDATHPGHYFIKSRSGASARTASAYTASIDAALTSLEAGLEYEISTLYGLAHVSVGLNLSEGGPESVTRKDGNVPLAICQASIARRARNATP